MTEQEMLSSLDEVEAELDARFPKAYSSGKLAQVKAHFATVRMCVGDLHRIEENEEHPDRKDGVIQRMVLAGRNMSDARDAVERGER